ncbi:MAG: hypothetical protein HQK54_18595, partial [Oligoflexales bacterium]|nr:hypothetical protein [Oligoflexales bacterium]
MYFFLRHVIVLFSVLMAVALSITGYCQDKLSEKPYETITDLNSVRPQHEQSVSSPPSDDRDLMDDLRFNSQEIFNQHRFGASLSAGSVVPWQKYGLGFHMRHTGVLWSILSGGGGKFHFNGSLDARNYKVSVYSTSL